MSYDEFGTAPAPLRIAVLVKQVPSSRTWRSGQRAPAARRHRARDDPYCRRAVAKGTELAQWSGGACTVLTLGPPSAEDCLREPSPGGLTDGVLITDPPLPVPTRWRQLARWRPRRSGGALRLDTHGTKLGRLGHGPGRPELAEMLGLPFLVGAKSVETDGDWLRAWCELDDGWRDAEVPLPAWSVARSASATRARSTRPDAIAVDPARCGRSRAASSARGPGRGRKPDERR